MSNAASKLSEFEHVLMGEVSGDLLMDYTRGVAGEVRLSGSPEELRAFEYAKRMLESFGLQTELTFHEAYISLPVEAAFSIGDESFPCITHSMSVSVDSLQGEAVYVDAAGLKAGADVAGKIVVLRGSGRANPGDVKRLTELGAAGAVFVSKQQYIHEMIVSPVWGNPTPDTAASLPVLPVVSVNDVSGERIVASIEAGTTGCVMTTVVDTGYRPIPTLTTEIKGAGAEEAYVLLSGHIDSWHLGVMDNGTANATMLEVARVLALYRDKLKRNVKLAFWSGHSHGRYAGSASYCDANWEDLYERCFIHVNVDSTGAIGATDLTHGHCLFETRDIAVGPIKAITGQDFEGVRLGRAGDHSFWGTGTPSLFMSLSTQAPEGGEIGGLGWWWHTPEDTIDKIDPAHLLRDTRIYALVVYRLAIAAVLPINHLATAAEIESRLSYWNERAAGRLDLKETLERAGKLTALIRELQELADGLPEDAGAALRTVNDGYMELSRALMQVLYVKGSIYDHDPATELPLVPKLMEIESLLEAVPGSDEERQCLTYLFRRTNEIKGLLSRATRAAAYAAGELRHIRGGVTA